MSRIKDFIDASRAVKLLRQKCKVEFNNFEYAPESVSAVRMPYYAVDASDGEGEYDDKSKLYVDLMHQLNQAKKNRYRAFWNIFGVMAK